MSGGKNRDENLERGWDSSILHEAFLCPLEGPSLSFARRWGSQEVIREVMGPPTPLAEGISRSVTWTDVLRWFSSYLRRVVIRKRK